jgi:F-box and WD-40 domain protein CDC4
METAGVRAVYAEYSPASSHSATLAPSSPETENPPTLATTGTMAEAHRSSNVPKFTALGHLRYAPATQTTVVTTTTTTTTSFPPLLFKAPRHLYNRDPKQYPLAGSPTPEGIKNFSFDVDGRPVCFSETDDLEGPLLEVSLNRDSRRPPSDVYLGAWFP